MELIGVAQRHIAILDHVHEELVTLQTFLVDNIHQFLNNCEDLSTLAVTNSLNIQLSRAAVCFNQSLAQSLLSIINRVITGDVTLVAINSQLDQIRINSHGINLL